MRISYTERCVYNLFYIIYSYFSYNTFIISVTISVILVTIHSAARPTSIKFDNNNILKIIKSLNANKAHEHDGISVRM